MLQVPLPFAAELRHLHCFTHEVFCWNGSEYTTWERVDSNISDFASLCSALGNVHTVCLADCGLGVDSTAELSKVLINRDLAVNVFIVDSTGYSGCAAFAVPLSGGPSKRSGHGKAVVIFG